MRFRRVREEVCWVRGRRVCWGKGEWILVTWDVVAASVGKMMDEFRSEIVDVREEWLLLSEII